MIYNDAYGQDTRKLWHLFQQGELTAAQYKRESIARFAQWKGAQEESHEQELRERYPGSSVVDVRHNPLSGFYDVTLTGTAWTTLLSIIGYARSCAALEQESLMEQCAREMLEALHQAEQREEKGEP